MAIPLVERAEQFKLEDLSQIDLLNNQCYSADLLKEHLSSSFDYPRVLLSPKGGGKTVVARKALNWYIQENQNSLPVMFVYKQNNRSEVLDYNKLATPEQWGEKRLEMLKNSSPQKLMQVSTAMVFDDYHWRFEDVAKGKENPENLVKDIKEVLNESKKGKSTIILSENPLGTYSEKIKIKGLDDILAEFGQFSYDKWNNSNFEERFEYINNINYHACSEISPPEFYEWSKIFSSYVKDAEDPVKRILYKINPVPRAVVKFAKMFYPEEKINMEMLNEKTVEVFNKSTEKIRSPAKLKIYGALMENPVIQPQTDIDVFSSVLYFVQGNLDTLEELYKNFPTVRYICEKTVRQLKPPPNCNMKKWEHDSAFALRTAEKKDWNEVNNALQNSMKEFTVEQREKLQSLVKTFYKKPVMSKFVGVYETLIDMRGRRGMDLELNRCSSGNIKRYYFQDEETHEWILYAPFKDAFTDLLRETPTLEILASRGKI